MDSPIFQRKEIEKELFDFDVEPQLPMTSWYQPTRDEAVDETIAGAPQLMKAGRGTADVPPLQLLQAPADQAPEADQEETA